jgi:hypothetical protein
MKSAITAERPGDAQLARARVIARALDTAIRIPGTKIRFGGDALLGLIPGIGDAAGAVFSAYLILLGSKLGLPTSTLVRMVGNVAIDTLVGSVPIVGDVFDVAWKSNMRNLALLEQATGAASATVQPRARKGAVIAAILALLILLGLSVAAAIWLVAALWHAVRT